MKLGTRIAALAAVAAACAGLLLQTAQAADVVRPSAPPAASAQPRSADTALTPHTGVWFGASVDWSQDSLATYSRRLGHPPAVAVSFTGFPMTSQEGVWLDQAVDQAVGTGSMVLLTLEPHDGLAAVTVARARELARRLAAINRRGVPVFVRFAHEMNGSWYPWGQDPAAYVAAFRRVAQAVHAATTRTAMMWAPHYGGGYPFIGGAHQAATGSAAAAGLDTNGDGTVSSADDPYRPYWPGRRHVDWVGMTLYHWGNAYPWGENEIPEAGKFVGMLRGTYDGTAGDERVVPDFYAEYAAEMRLPLAVAETAAFYAPGRGGATELAVKQAWWKQMSARSIPRQLPQLKMINWFEWRKHEPEVGGIVDWTATRDRTVRARFARALPAWLRYARTRR